MDFSNAYDSSLRSEVENLRSRIHGLEIKSGMMRRGICIEVISDPDRFDYAKYEAGWKKDAEIDITKLEDSNVFDSLEKINIPRNTIIFCTTESRDDLFYVARPFFSEHMILPVKPGEQFWYFTVDNEHFWMSRAGADRIAEDVNFTHFDRKFLEQTSKTSAEKADQQNGNGEEYVPGFQDGNETPDGKSLQNISYSKIIKGNLFYNEEDIKNKFESVPRLRKNPADLVLQGSNNTAIILGQDNIRSQGENDDSFQNIKTAPAAIDIVLGRGVMDTAAYSIKNELGFYERHKNPQASNLVINPIEGDPSYDDKARINLCQEEPIALSFRDDLYSVFGTEFPVFSAGTNITIHSNNNKIVAKSGGSVQIIKQGKLEESENDPNVKYGSSIILDPLGQIQITGQKIFLGISKVDGGIFPDEELEELGPDNSQPYILYFELKNLMEKLITDLDAFCGTLETHVSVPAGGVIPQVIQACAELKTALSSRKDEIPTIASKRIFGE